MSTKATWEWLLSPSSRSTGEGKAEVKTVSRLRGCDDKDTPQPVLSLAKGLQLLMIRSADTRRGSGEAVGK